MYVSSGHILTLPDHSSPLQNISIRFDKYRNLDEAHSSRMYVFSFTLLSITSLSTNRRQLGSRASVAGSKPSLVQHERGHVTGMGDVAKTSTNGSSMPLILPSTSTAWTRNSSQCWASSFRVSWGVVRFCGWKKKCTSMWKWLQRHETGASCSWMATVLKKGPPDSQRSENITSWPIFSATEQLLNADVWTAEILWSISMGEALLFWASSPSVSNNSTHTIYIY